MTLHRKAPQKGAKNRRIHFPFITTPRGYSWDAHIAGPCHWFDCHEIGRSKPCLHCITDGELPCEKNHDIDEPVEIGYQPLWQKDNGRPGFVIVYEYARESIDKLQLHCQVTVSRAKGKSDTVSIAYSGLNLPKYRSTREDFMRPVDLTESLLRIWKIPELVAWVRWKQGNGVKPEMRPAKNVPKLKPLKSDGKEFSPVTAKAAEKAEAANAGNVGDSYADVLKKAKEREERHRKNGHLDTVTE